MGEQQPPHIAHIDSVGIHNKAVDFNVKHSYYTVDEIKFCYRLDVVAKEEVMRCKDIGFEYCILENKSNGEYFIDKLQDE